MLRVCVQALVEGHPQAFVEFFQLTHRPAPAAVAADAEASAPDARDPEAVPPESLGLLKASGRGGKCGAGQLAYDSCIARSKGRAWPCPTKTLWHRGVA